MSESRDVKKLPPKNREILSVIIPMLCFVLIALHAKFLRYSLSEKQDLLQESLEISSVISNAVKNYQDKNKNQNISALDTPVGTMKKGFINGSPLFEQLDLNTESFKQFENLNVNDFYLEFVNDGKDGQYNIVCEPARGKQNGVSEKGPVDGFFEFNPKTFKIRIKFYPSNFDKFMHKVRES